MDRSYPKSRPAPQSITVAAHCTQVDGENAFGIASDRELVLTLRPIGAGNLKLGSFGKYEHGPAGLGSAVICIDRIGFRYGKSTLGSRTFRSFHSFGSPIRATKVNGTLVGVW